ncbi:OmpA family protein [Thiocapsa rosea]
MRYLLDRLDTDVTVGLISNTHQSLGDLIHWICLAFDIRVSGGTKLDLHQAFVDFLIDRYANGKRVLLIVDEAQNLGVEKLEELRLLSNINSGKDLILQLMLLGQPQLRDLLRHSDLEQFVQRISASYHLGRLDAEETKNYIQHRIFIAGGRYPIFSNDACHAVQHYSGGIPRIINLICDTALVYAYGAGEKKITGTAIDEFIASHANHLLIPIDRDASEHPVPRQRLDDPDEDANEEDIDAGRKSAVLADAGTTAQGGEINPVSVSQTPASADVEAARHSPMQTDALSRLSSTEQPDRPLPTPLHPRASANEELLPSTASALQIPDVPAPTMQTGIAGAHGAGSSKPYPAETSAAKSPGGSPNRLFIVGEPPPSSLDKKRSRWPGVLAATAILLSIVAAAVWFGGSSVSEQVRTTIIEWLEPTQQPPDEAKVTTAPTTDQADPLTGSPVSPASDTPAVPAARPEQPSEPASSVERPPGSIDDSPDRLEGEARSAGSDSPAKDAENALPEAELPGEAVPASAAPIANDQPVNQSSDFEGTTTRPAVPATYPLPDQALDAAPESTAADTLQPGENENEQFASLERRFEQLSFETERNGDRLIANLGRSVQFADGSSELDAAARRNLRQVADALKDAGGIQIRVVGHTDSSGTESVNQWLSGRRAGVVAGYLADQGIPDERLDHEGRGHAEPKIDADQERIQGPWVNRRIELEVSAAPLDAE